jgi:hypothetical protein
MYKAMGHFLRVPFRVEHCRQLLLLSNGMSNINKIDIKDRAKSSCILLFQLLRQDGPGAAGAKAFKNENRWLLFIKRQYLYRPTIIFFNQ